jgi:SAM-dependent methyltransferase
VGVTTRIIAGKGGVPIALAQTVWTYRAARTAGGWLLTERTLIEHCNRYMSGPAELRVREEDVEYRRQATAEAQFWERIHPAGLESTEQVQAQGPLDRYLNRRFTGDENVTWPETIRRHGRFLRGAFLGTSSLRLEGRILESNPSLHMTFFDLSEGGLSRRQAQLGERFPGRIATRLADLNFIELTPDTYDVIISSSTTHHVTNLEHLAYQINRALVRGGYFFLDDYVGEPRFQFAPEKKAVYQELFNRDCRRRGSPPSDLVWLDSSDLSPFCGVRSNEILQVFRGCLEEVELRTAGTLTVAITRSRPATDSTDSPWVSDAWSLRRRTRFYWTLARRFLSGCTPSSQTVIPAEFWHELHLFGEALSAAGMLQPGLAFARYRKR